MTDLTHYGVKGMRWGVKKDRRTESSSDYTQYKKLKREKLRTLSNKELETVLRRQNLERRYREMNPSISKKVADFISKKVVSKIWDHTIKSIMEGTGLDEAYAKNMRSIGGVLDSIFKTTNPDKVK